MLPANLLTKQDYQTLASKLLAINDQENFIEQCEKTYLDANRNFYEHLEEAVSGLYYPMSEYDNLPSNFIITPPPDEGTVKKTIALIKAYAERTAKAEIGASERESNPDFTTARQVLAMRFLLDPYNVWVTVDKTHIARFIEFLTGKNYDNIYKKVKTPYSTKNKNFRKEDFQFIRTYFENLGLSDIVKKINNELEERSD